MLKIPVFRGINEVSTHFPPVELIRQISCELPFLTPTFQTPVQLENILKKLKDSIVFLEEIL